ncbi:MAG: MFS transporter [Armatimonadetes bacterium]|nr:MFS transporter [Armatimonadota bacterium]MDW8122829.1 MFS transporter [Armatimonadota bacterium]
MSERSSSDPLKTKVFWWTGLTSYHWLVLIVASLGWAFDTMDQWLYVLARQPALADLLGVAREDPQVRHYGGVVQSLFLFGWATGGFLFGIVGDRLGRTKTMAVTILLYALFTGASGIAQTWWEFAIYRVIAGLGVGGEFASGAALVAEVFPDHARTQALGLMQASSAIGNMGAGLINATIGASPHWGWRWVFAVGMLPALLVFVIRFFLKEPQRWQDAKAKERAGLSRLGDFAALFRHPVWRHHTLVGIGLAAIGVMGFWGIGTFSPDLLRLALNPKDDPALRFWVERWTSLAVMSQNFGAFFGIIGWAWLAHAIGRRPAFYLAFLLCFLIIPLTFFGTRSLASAFVFFPVMGFFTTSLFGGYAVYFPELFPTHIRATGVGFCYNVARYLSIIAPYTFGRISSFIGIRWAGSLMACVFLLAFLILPFAPETKGRPLLE